MGLHGLLQGLLYLTFYIYKERNNIVSEKAHFFLVNCYLICCHMGNVSKEINVHSATRNEVLSLLSTRDKRRLFAQHFPARQQWVSAANLKAIKELYRELQPRLCNITSRTMFRRKGHGGCGLTWSEGVYLLVFKGCLEVGPCTEDMWMGISVKETDYGMIMLNWVQI
jgi:hypothetical protein